MEWKEHRAQYQRAVDRFVCGEITEITFICELSALGFSWGEIIAELETIDTASTTGNTDGHADKKS